MVLGVKVVNLLKNKKAMAFLIIGVGFLLTAILMMVAEVKTIDHNDFVGRHQYQLLQTNELSKEIQNYVNLATKYSLEYAKDYLFKYSGFYQEFDEQGNRQPLQCGRYQYPLFFTDKDCFPDFEDSLKSYFNEAFNKYLSRYNKTDIQFSYDLSLNQEKNNLHLLSESNNYLKLYIDTKKTTNNIFINTVLGTYGAEKIINCTTGECVADIAKYYTKIYRQDGTMVDYVWGGETPYPIADTTKLAQQKGSFFYGVNPQASEPGFDCSGWVWWVEKHSGIKDFNQRLTANDYYELAKKDAKKICSFNTTPCLRDEILKNAEPGDILFYGTDEKVSHIMIYLGDGKISHSRESKGLTIEPLPESYASNSKTNIVAVYRFPYNTKGQKSFNSTEQSNSNIKITNNGNNSTNLIGPVAFCKDTKTLPSKTYRTQITKKAWNSKDLTYFDIAVDTGLKQGIDPALIVSHMVLESSLGRNDRCQEYGKSHLTGCAWYNSCSQDCSCNSGFVSSDYAQATCTASTDKNAFLEAETGKKVSNGYYTKCEQYKNNPEKQWTCILCTYQGNYDHDVTGNNRPYFTKDGTCDYAENFKKTYCSWRNYFSEKGYAVNATYSDSGSITNSYLEYKPYMDAETNLNLKELEEIKTFINQTEENCKDNLRVCIKQEINNFNKNHKVQILMNWENDSLARDLIDQVDDCYLNEQTNCICPIKINPALNDRNFEKYFIRFKDDGTVFSSDYSKIRQSYDFETVKQLTKLDFIPSIVSWKYSEDPEKRKYVDFIIDKKEPTANSMELEKPYSRDPSWSLNTQKTKTDDVAIKKTTFQTLVWQPYKTKEPTKECRDNKRYFRLQAITTFTKTPLDFSIKLKDTTPPQITIDSLKQENELTPRIKITWEINANTDPAYDFIIAFNDQTNQFRTFEKSAKTATMNEKPFQLYKTEFDNKIVYNYVIDRTPDENPLQPNKTYSISVYVRDNYENIQKSQEQQITIQPIQNTPGSTITEAKNIINTISKQTEPVNYEIVKLKRNKVFSITNEKTSAFSKTNINESENKIPEIPSTPTNFQLIPYNGLFNPETGEQLYRIQNIPNVQCSETSSTLKSLKGIKTKYCAASKDLILALDELSKTELVPNNYKLVITQAFRTKELQQLLWDDLGHNPKLVCDPNRKICPHQEAGAIDVKIYDQKSSGVFTNGRQLPPQETEKIMCKVGFVRYHGETWHFEYGTPQWDLAESKRERGENVCTY